MIGLRLRLLILELIFTAGLVGPGVEAQPARVVKIGALTESWGPTPAIIGLRDGLQEPPRWRPLESLSCSSVEVIRWE